MKSGFVAILGRPSTGKSTLLNSICKHQISITSPNPQTTRNKIRGIYTDERGQIVFIDTPGFHLSKKKFNIAMMKNIHSSIKEAELILYLIDIQDKPEEEENEIFDIINNSKIKFLTLINKIDLKNTEEIEIMKFLNTKKLNNQNIIKISAAKKINIKNLKNKIFENLKEGSIYYPTEYYTDQEIHFRISEIIRGETIKMLKKELPYSLYVNIETLENQKRAIFAMANIYVINESQKGIIVGKKGGKIKEIGEKSRKIISNVFKKKCNLFLQVKLKKKWNKEDKLLKKLIN